MMMMMMMMMMLFGYARPDQTRNKYGTSWQYLADVEKRRVVKKMG